MPAAKRGYDGGKKVPGRKRHVVTDCLGLLLAVAVTAANVGDREAAVPLLERVVAAHRSLRLIWADGGYTGVLVDWAREKLHLTLEIVKRSDAPRFVVLPRRWVVEGDAELADAVTPAGTRLRNPARHQRVHNPVVDDHAHEPPPRPPHPYGHDVPGSLSAPSRRHRVTALNSPD
ncbi:transposase [Streptomyces rubiginosohelvolus]|uniref:transposase n=1 Tax=Streptomyces rubiginosohelvolus TaxID=67362 RepID=UPI00369C6F8C